MGTEGGGEQLEDGGIGITVRRKGVGCVQLEDDDRG